MSKEWMNDLTIVIPSKGRAKNQRTLRKLPRSILHRVVLVVPKNEYKDYKKQWLKEYPDISIIARDSKLEKKTVSAVRQWIITNVVKTRYFIMMDDDIQQFCYRRHNDTGEIVRDIDRKDNSYWKAVVADDKIILRGIKEMVSLMASFPAVGCSPRQFNNGLYSTPFEKDSVKDTTGIRLNSRLYCCWGGRTAYFKKHVRMDEVRQKEDYHAILTILSRGHRVACITWFMHDSQYAIDKGGCFGEREKIGHDAASKDLAKRWPEFVKITEKKNYSQTENRIETVVYWQKAYKSGVQRANQ